MCRPAEVNGFTILALDFLHQNKLRFGNLLRVVYAPLVCKALLVGEDLDCHCLLQALALSFCLLCYC